MDHCLPLRHAKSFCDMVSYGLIFMPIYICLLCLLTFPAAISATCYPSCTYFRVVALRSKRGLQMFSGQTCFGYFKWSEGLFFFISPTSLSPGVFQPQRQSVGRKSHRYLGTILSRPLPGTTVEILEKPKPAWSVQARVDDDKSVRVGENKKKWYTTAHSPFEFQINNIIRIALKFDMCCQHQYEASLDRNAWIIK